MTAGGLRAPKAKKRSSPVAVGRGLASFAHVPVVDEPDLIEVDATEIESLSGDLTPNPLIRSPALTQTAITQVAKSEDLSVEESLSRMLGSELPMVAGDWDSAGALQDEASGVTLVKALTLKDVISSPVAAVADLLPPPVPSAPPPLPKINAQAPLPPIELPPSLPATAPPRPASDPPKAALPRSPSLKGIIEINSAPIRQPSLIPGPGVVPPMEARSRAPSLPPTPPPSAPAKITPALEAKRSQPPAPANVPVPLPRSPSITPQNRTDSGRPTPSAPSFAWLAKKRSTPGPKGEIVVGIDLGTTYSCVAIAQDSGVRVLSTRRGLPTLPSTVAFDPSGRTLLGDAAQRYLPTDPESTIVGWKRLLGRAYDSPIVEDVRRHFAYKIVPGSTGDAAVEVHGYTVSLEEVAAEILEELRIAASMQVEGKINRAVITCPAHFNEAQRGAIRRAGELAGFHVERVLSEPTAAALAFGFGKGFEGKKLLVYDLGGGTFDVSLLLVRGETYEVLATGGDTFLGGMDFDASIVRLLVEAMIEKHKIDPRTDPSAIAKLMQFAERAKRELSTRESTIVEIDHLVVQPHAARSLSVALQRNQVEKLFSPIIDHTLEIVLDVCHRAGMEPKAVDEVICVGGQTRTPIIGRKVRSMIGKEPKTGIDPDEAVALGAALFARSVDKKSAVKLVDALPMSIGVGLPGGRFHKLIPRDSALPAVHLHPLRTTKDNQPSLELFFFQGEADQAEHNEPLGSLVLSGLPKGPKGTVVVEVKLRVDEEQILSVTAKEQKTGKSIEAKFGTQATPKEMREKLGLPPEPSQEDLKKRRYQVGRPKGVWGWLTKVLGR